jgi:hypothetical protein
MYNAQVLKGLVVLVAFAVVFNAVVLLRALPEVLVPAFYLAAVIDAVRIAGKKTEGRKVGAWEFF